jgi:hypothetical protein
MNQFLANQHVLNQNKHCGYNIERFFKRAGRIPQVAKLLKAKNTWTFALAFRLTLVLEFKYCTIL